MDIKPDIVIRYRFVLQDGRVHDFTVTIDPRTLEMRQPPRSLPPVGWTALRVHQCSHCPFSAATTPECPVAINIESVIDTVGVLVSYETVHVEITSAERRIVTDLPAQNAISSIMGLIIATSACPHTAFLKPMARFHLPLASVEETLYRVIGTYLLGEYFREREHPAQAPSLDGLNAIYNRIDVMNQALARRIGEARTGHDAGINALMILATYAQSMTLFIEIFLPEIRSLFTPYLEQSPSEEC